MNVPISASSVLFFVCFMWILTGCEVNEWQALRKYSHATQKQLPKQMALYARHLKRATQQKERTQLRSLLSTHVLPALEKYVETLQRIRTRSLQIRTLHTQLTNAYIRWYGALKTFSTQLNTDEQHVRAAHTLLRESQQLQRAEKAYQQGRLNYLKTLTKGVQ